MWLFVSRTSDFEVSFTGIKKIERDDYDLNVGIKYNLTKYFAACIGLSNTSFSSGCSLMFEIFFCKLCFLIR